MIKTLTVYALMLFCNPICMEFHLLYYLRLFGVITLKIISILWFVFLEMLHQVIDLLARTSLLKELLSFCPVML